MINSLSQPSHTGDITFIHPLGVVTQYHPWPMASGDISVPTPSGWINAMSLLWSGDNLPYNM